MKSLLLKKKRILNTNCVSHL